MKNVDYRQSVEQHIPPPYAPNSFKNEKAQTLIKYILSREGWVLEIEGGMRGGKDVYGLYGWSQFLMVTPDTEHLALGVTLDHAIVNILNSHGFGLQHTIPSGKFTRESLDGGANRGMFKFYDAFGVEKKVYFYGNQKHDDYRKFKGFTLGSVYAVEANEQHINGLIQAKNRTNASLRPRFIITQNPKGASHIFYTEFESPLIATADQNLMYRQVKLQVEELFKGKEKELQGEMEKERQNVVKTYLKRHGIPNADVMSPKQKAKLAIKLRELKELWFKQIRNVTVAELLPQYSDYEVGAISAQIICQYQEYFDNPNEVYNGLEFAYFHFTHDDNLSMSDADRARIDRTYDTSSPTYLRDIRGMRATVDHAVWGTFTEANIFDEDFARIPELRVLACDLGYDHPFGVLDAVIDSKRTLWVIDEMINDPNKEKENANNVEYIARLKRFINSRFNGEYDRIWCDPSAKGFINQAVSSKLHVIKAKNRVRNRKTDERTESDKSVEDRKTAGIDLVREGFRIKKIMVHRRCKNLIKQIQGYAFDPKKLELGIEVPIKIRDDLNDPLRYITNSEIGYVGVWERGDTVEQEDKETVLGEEVSESEQNGNALEELELRKKYTKSLVDAFRQQQGIHRHLF